MITFLLLITITYFIWELCSFDLTWLTILPAILYLICRSVPRGQMFFFIGYGLFLLFQLDTLFNSFRLLLNEGIVASAKWGWSLPLQEVNHNDASLGIGLLLVFISLIFSIRTLWIIILLAIGLPFLLQQPFHLISFGLLFSSCLLAISYMKHQTLSVGHMIVVCLICCLLIPIQFIPGFQQIGYVLEQGKDKLQYGANAQTQLTNGHLQQLSSFERTATPAFTIAMEQPKPMYLKSYIGSRYQNGWTSIEEDLLQDATIQKYLQEEQYFQQTQFAQAAQPLENNAISIEPFGISKEYALTPYELSTAVNDFTISSDVWRTKQLFGSSSYTYQISDRSYTDYPAVASELYHTDDTPYLKLEALHNYLSYRYYVDLPQETRTILQNHFELPEHQSYEQTIANVQEHLTTITYNEKTSKADAEFIQFLLEESKEGYSVHYATLATLLFRAYGIPARYVEGYILTNEDVSERKEITVTSDSRHAWTEIYIDWIGWMPVEVTPGYSEKMPPLAITDFEQNSSTNMQSINPAPALSQVANPPLEDNPSPEIKESTDTSLLWYLLLLIVPLVILWAKRRKRNQMQYLFMKFIRTSNTAWATSLPVHQVIYKINTPEALEAYQLYNIMMYQQQPLTGLQKKHFKQLLKTVRKQIKEEA